MPTFKSSLAGADRPAGPRSRRPRIDRVFLYGIAGLSASALCVSVSLWRGTGIPDLCSVASCFLSGPGIVAAAWLARQGLRPSRQLRRLHDLAELRLYLLLGALALGWVSAVAISKECRRSAVRLPVEGHCQSISPSYTYTSLTFPSSMVWDWLAWLGGQREMKISRSEAALLASCDS